MKRKIKFSLSIFLVSILIISCDSKPKQEEKQTQAKEKLQTEESNSKNIIFFGNSLTAGYGVAPEEAFAGLVQKRLDSLEYDYKVINAGISGETTASGLSRVQWVVKRQDLSIFVLELGGNDGLRGIQPQETEKNLRAIIKKVKAIHPEAKILLAGMMVPPNMGKQYADKFQKIFPSVAKDTQVNLIPFLLQNVGGEEDLNQPDGIHPTAEGHKIVVETVWKHLKPLLEKKDH